MHGPNQQSKRRHLTRSVALTEPMGHVPVVLLAVVGPAGARLVSAASLTGVGLVVTGATAGTGAERAV